MLICPHDLLFINRPLCLTLRCLSPPLAEMLFKEEGKSSASVIVHGHSITTLVNYEKDCVHQDDLQYACCEQTYL